MMSPLRWFRSRLVVRLAPALLGGGLGRPGEGPFLDLKYYSLVGGRPVDCNVAAKDEYSLAQAKTNKQRYQSPEDRQVQTAQPQQGEAMDPGQQRLWSAQNDTNFDNQNLM